MPPSTPDSSAFFPRSFRLEYPVAARAEDLYIWDENGTRYLDACGGAAVVTIGHGVPEVRYAIAEQLARVDYVHSSQFLSRPGLELAFALRSLCPAEFAGGAVYFTSGGSEAIETAMKLARQYQVERGHLRRFKILGRRQSYHGSTLAALAVGDNPRRSQIYAPMLQAWSKAPPAPAGFPTQQPPEMTAEAYAIGCADALEAAIVRENPDTVAAFICEPVSGATLGAAAPPPGYLKRIREICSTYQILFIADEVMTGMGRTGRYFACELYGVVPDLLVLGKGLASGYAPVGALIASTQVCDALRNGSGTFQHGFTYHAHPASLAGALAVLRYLEKHDLVARAAAFGPELSATLQRLADDPHVGNVRGVGMLWAVEIVADRKTQTPFPAANAISSQLAAACRNRGVLVYPVQGSRDGINGDHVLIAPPFTFTRAACEELHSAVQASLEALHERSRAAQLK